MPRLVVDPPVFEHHEATGRLGPALAPLRRCGVLGEIAPAGVTSCRDCGGGHRCRVEFVTDVRTRQQHGYISCPECGPVEIDPNALRRWRIDIDGFLDIVLTAARIRGPAHQTLSGRLWRLGKVTWAGRSREVYFARSYRPREDEKLVAELTRRPKSVLLVPTETVAGRWGAVTANPLIALESVLAWEDESIRFDVPYVEGLLEPDRAPRERPPEKRGRRAATIERLRGEMIQHLRAARDHAYATRERTGTPALLPRPSQKQLARRVGVSESNVSRSLKDPAAGELQLYWSMALDLDQIMGWRPLASGGCG